MKPIKACERLYGILMAERADTICIKELQRRLYLGFNDARELIAILERKKCGRYLEDGIRFTVDLEALLKQIDPSATQYQVFCDLQADLIDTVEQNRSHRD